MAEKKLFCVLEQSGEMPSENTWIKKDAFATSFSDFKRINWRTVDDSLSCGYYPGITWSEGRSILFELAKSQYEYLVFLDDDVEFSLDKSDLAITIAELLKQYAPFSATFFDHKSWAFHELNNICYENSAPFCVRAFDLQTFILKTSFAKMVMPIPFHGFDKSMWYVQYLATRAYPQKQICFPIPFVRNTRHEIHVNDSGKLHCLHGDLLFWRFSRLSTRRRDIPSILNQKSLAFENKEVAATKVDQRSFDPELKRLTSIIDVNATDWASRKALMTHVYHKRNFTEYWKWRLIRLYLWPLDKIKQCIKKAASRLKN